jgi:serine/threonine protein phosphatase PrpC
MLIYDPPGGWRYGFPKPYKPLDGETLAETLLRDGYPQAEIDNGMAEHCRFIGDIEELKVKRDMKFEITHASEKGLRSYQEDRHIVYHAPDEGYLLAVFDGHGGSETADYCANRLIALYHEVRSKLLVANFESIILGIFQELNKATQRMHSGCAASIAIIKEDGSEVIVGVLGDAPVLVKNDGVWCSPEHNVRSNPAEAKTAQQRGGFISGGYLFAEYSGSGLQMSRALGDYYLDKVLSREPEIFRLPLKTGDYVLVASDGLFDPSHATHPQVSINLLIEAGADATRLVQNALDVPTGDNVTAVLVKLS